MIDAEVDRMYREFEGRMQQSGFTAKQFLEATHQTEEAIRAQMSPEAAARVKTQLVLEAIVKAESIEASDEDVEKEFTTMSEMYNMEVEKLQKEINEKYGVNMQVMIYGDGAFKDPIGKIWELADPVVSPGYTKDLEGTPNELKIKYIADTDLKDMTLAKYALELMSMVATLIKS